MVSTTVRQGPGGDVYRSRDEQNTGFTTYLFELGYSKQTPRHSAHLPPLYFA